MCRRTQLIGIILLSLGAGFILSSLLVGTAIRIIIGAILLLIGLATFK